MKFEVESFWMFLTPVLNQSIMTVSPSSNLTPFILFTRKPLKVIYLLLNCNLIFMEIFFSLCMCILWSPFYIICKVELASTSLWIINNTGFWWMYNSIDGSRIAQVPTAMRFPWLCVFSKLWEWRWVSRCCILYLVSVIWRAVL